MRSFGIAALGATLLLAQDPSQPIPRFRTGVDVVLLDVTVLDKDRRPARGLKAADFTILEDGKPQPIVSFDELDAPEPDGALVPWMREVASDVRTNAADDRRLIALVLDDANINFKYREDVKRIGRAVVDGIGPADQVVVIYTGNNARSQEFTNDRAALRAAIDRYVDTVMPTGVRAAVDTLHRSVDTLLAIPHRRKALIFVSSLQISFGSDDITFRVNQMLRAAQRANVSFYPINPAGLQVLDEPGPDLINETAQVLASNTGGFAHSLSSRFEDHVKQIFRETGSYYLLGFQSTDRDGSYRRIQVRVNRPGLTARTRTGHTSPKEEKASKKNDTLPVIKSVSSVLPVPDVPVRVTVAPFATPGSSTPTVVFAIGVQQPPPTARVVEKVEVLSTAFDTSYRSRGVYRQVAQMTLRPTGDASDVKFEILSKLSLPPGRYNLRFGVHSASLKKSGSVYQEVVVPDFAKAAVSLSGVALGVEPSLPMAPKGFLASVLPISPTTQRVFVRGHQATAFVRVYRGGKDQAGNVSLTTTIVDDQDRTVHASTEMLEPARFDASRAFDHRFPLPLDRLTAGAYLLRFSASDGKVAATRDVRFVLR